jgi:hypothetical protein
MPSHGRDLSGNANANGARTILAFIAVALIVATFVLRAVTLPTSLVKVVTTPLPAATATATGAAPAATATPTVTGTPTAPVPATTVPAASVTPAVAASPPSETDTTTSGTASDTLELGLLALAGLFALMAVFYKRITAFTGPGGWGITLSPAQKAAASKAVAKKARSRAASSITSSPASGRRIEPGARLVQMAVKDEGTDPGHALDAAKDAVQHVSEATLQAAQLAQTLLTAAQASPNEFRALANEWGIPVAESLPVLDGEISNALWERLAERALEETSPVPQTG